MVKTLKPRYFGDTDIEENCPKNYSDPPKISPKKLSQLPPGDYRSLPNSRNRNSSRNSHSRTVSKRLARGRSPGSLASSRNSSESEVDSHNSKASHVSTGSNRWVFSFFFLVLCFSFCFVYISLHFLPPHFSFLTYLPPSFLHLSIPPNTL